jgi:hypothetical protein
MRDYRILILILTFTSCKTTQVTQSNEIYEEDLSIYRIEGTVDPPNIIPDGQVEIAEGVVLTGDITAEIDSINSIIIAQNKVRNSRDGFTIQIYVGDSRSNARKALSYLKKYYPDLDSKISYRQPNYHVKAGAFFQRLEATRTYCEIKTSFPKAILLPEKQALIKGNE